MRMPMKPNNLVALLVVVLLLAIGIALAVINSRSESETPKQATGKVLKHLNHQPIHLTGQNDANLS